MNPVPQVTGLAASLMRDNIDTDVIIPSREITSPSREGYAVKLFSPWRYLSPGGPENPDFVLNRGPWRQARILVAGRNFGCGSSREMAVWALVQFGIQCVIAPSFGAIFRDNCIRNALVPVELPQAAVAALAAAAEAAPLQLHVDVAAGTVRTPDGTLHGFSLGDDDRERLISGHDAIERTLRSQAAAIAAFETADRQRRPWAWPA